MSAKSKLPKGIAAMLFILAMMIVFNAAAVFFPAAADFYADNIFPVLSGVISAVSGILPFSLGETLIGAGIAILFAAPFVFGVSAVRKNKKALKFFGYFYGWVIIYIIVTETLNCFVLYRTTPFSDKFHDGAGAEGFTVSELTSLCEETALNAAALAETVKRDDEGRVAVPGNMEKIAQRSMNILAQDYPQLGGYYPRPKQIRSDVLMTQFDLQGIYFPFTLEANYNSALSPARVPCTVMHELSHLKGFIREDEACFIACRACFEAEEPEVRYSGYLSALNYLYGEAKKYASPEEWQRLCSLITPQMREDNIFVSEEHSRYVEENAVIPTEKAQAVSAKAMDTTLKIGGVKDGKKSYNRMVTLLLEYRYCISEE